MAPNPTVKLLNETHAEAGPHEITDQTEAFKFLEKAARQKGNMAHYTELWEQLRPKRLKGRKQKDRDILRGVAALMAEGKLRPRTKVSGGSGSKEEERPALPPRGPHQTFAGSDMKLRMPVEAVVASALPPINVAQQVEALKAAALSGLPFVAQCR